MEQEKEHYFGTSGSRRQPKAGLDLRGHPRLPRRHSIHVSVQTPGLHTDPIGGLLASLVPPPLWGGS